MEFASWAEARITGRQRNDSQLPFSPAEVGVGFLGSSFSRGGALYQDIVVVSRETGFFSFSGAIPGRETIQFSSEGREWIRMRMQLVAGQGALRCIVAALLLRY